MGLGDQGKLGRYVEIVDDVKNIDSPGDKGEEYQLECVFPSLKTDDFIE